MDDSSLNPHPALAESWDVDKDFTTATFHLKKGVMFHTGRELTSDDVVAEMEGVTTTSEGEEPRRRVVIRPA